MPDVSEDELMCRICWDDEPKADLISPCDCKGSLKYVHRRCLNDWYANSNNKTCGSCKAEMVPVWTGFKPFPQWAAALHLEGIQRRPLHHFKRVISSEIATDIIFFHVVGFAYTFICDILLRKLLDEQTYKEVDAIHRNSIFRVIHGMFLGLLAKYVFCALSIYDWTSKKNRNLCNWSLVIVNLVMFVTLYLYPTHFVIFMDSFLYHFME